MTFVVEHEVDDGALWEGGGFVDDQTAALYSGS
jgi:hypothetical protein